ncbi:ribonuclease R [Blattabacterium cuenoti]|uniref:ribonuclease R n=1 Tax=Blattabacterium cuenoti TaxID=1653831 RepID=UPI00163D36B9|nr:ribonuclease R [Blattabacterium cuenoti]
MKLKGKKKNFVEKNSFLVTGHISVTSYGFAFFKNIEGDTQDVFISKKDTNRAINGDLVLVKITKKKSRKKIKGKVLKIIKRKRKNFVGVLKLKTHSKYAYVKVYDNTIHVDILIQEQELKIYKNNEKVLTNIILWPKESKNPIGKIIKSFGISGEYNTEIFSLLFEYGFPYKFSKKIEKETKKIMEKENFDLRLRRDMRHINTFTIDPLDAKDFDDALSIKKLDSETWEIGIHIADVSYYIKEGSLLDKEAYNRATSIYLMGKVIPMLPEEISNNLCSLLPEEDKLCFSYIFNMNSKGKILKNWFGKTIIRSNKRFTYEEVQEIIEKNKGEYHEDIMDLFFFSKIISKNRLKNGAIFLDRFDTKFHLDSENNPIDIFFEKNHEAHRLIEEFMLLTNRKISEFVSLNLDGKPSRNTYVYRIHEEPDYQKISFLKSIIEPLGYILDLKNLKDSINSILKKIHGKPEKNMIENSILRCMSKAKYSTKNRGHYGLSFIYYSHFTSPIRRYSDIIAHRLLCFYLSNKKNEIKPIDFYEEQSKHCSNQERLAIDVEREFLKFMQVKYIKKFLGKKFNGVIIGLTEWCIYIDLLFFQIEGMIRLRDLKEDYYSLHSNNYSIIGKNKGKIFRLGDKIQVKIIDVNIEKKKIILEWLMKKDKIKLLHKEEQK